METPNLFKFATSELSQDAFIAWLLSWANPEYKGGSDKHKALNKIAIDILTLFFQKSGKKLPNHIENIDVRRQVNHIDVLCVINDTYAVLIEDKVGTVQHSNQLARYKQYLMTKQHQPFAEDKIISIYLQTHDQSSYDKVMEHGFYPVLRKDLLQVFDNADNEAARQSDIYANYYYYLQSIETAVQSFRTVPVHKWKRHAWKGFFIYLQSQLGEGRWKYVAN
ncbi:PD-(D/E)XK nuclease family protein [Psychrobacter sp. FDAARGOS_221]|uniref:PD-(D/E)XK nuclease family protein n=1 Tax=Psychrobacter sp. FDAARGOS_221 TaxID=1975705 RepID=UPI00187D4B5F|nr:PD-(D/E)XK nuclease family protein [Psychrobacter sp. FDAARGOS_221]